MTSQAIKINREMHLDNIKIKLSSRYIINYFTNKWNKLILFLGSTEYFKNIDHVFGQIIICIWC